jgi:hypothetical protein
VPFFGSIPAIVILDVPPFATAAEERVPMSPQHGAVLRLADADERGGKALTRTRAPMTMLGNE